MNDRVTGLILNQKDYRENGALVTVLTRQYGRITLSARGIRKLTSKNAASLFPYTKGEFLFDYKPGRTIFALRTAETKQFYSHIHTDLKAQCTAAVIAEIADNLSSEQAVGVNPEIIYDLCEQAFTLVDQDERSDLVLAVYMARSLDLFGIGPQVDGCAIDGDVHVKSISAAAGGFLCPACTLKEHALVRTPQELRQFRLVNKAQLEHLEILKPLVAKADWINDILESFFEIHGSMYLKSWNLYRQVR
ncbi:MAG TPA: DNA repair protein RecO [Erysipelotrichaceae bacterium]|nr:DNA repair protein RecO [Erysipelotrichaceae bacterium]HCW55603.1 DNA repair protein RecO [Erysipelotrichaceae bacterium]